MLIEAFLGLIRTTGSSFDPLSAVASSANTRNPQHVLWDRNFLKITVADDNKFDGSQPKLLITFASPLQDGMTAEQQEQFASDVTRALYDNLTLPLQLAIVKARRLAGMRRAFADSGNSLEAGSIVYFCVAVDSCDTFPEHFLPRSCELASCRLRGQSGKGQGNRPHHGRGEYRRSQEQGLDLTIARPTIW